MTNLIDNIKLLREMTGAGFLDCKKALEENSNDVNISVDFLRKKGLAKASKKSSREAKEGAVGIYSNDFLTTVIKINTETDFAAKNEIFLNFMDEIGKYSLQNKNIKLSLEEFNNMIFNERSIADRIKDIIAKIGENIVLSSLKIIDKSSDTIISSYIHNPYKKNIGKIAVTLKIKAETFDENLIILGKNLCMHIAACKPLSMTLDKLDKKIINNEKEIQLETIKNTGKSEEIANKILEGKMKKFYSETVLLNQLYILDPDKSIQTIISNFSKENKIEIINYNLTVIGN